MNKEPVFKEGDIAICLISRGYNITEGREYVVLKYEPKQQDDNFTWPAYVGVVDDSGREIITHARRFKSKQET